MVVNEETNVSSQAFTEGDGAYRVPFLIPSKYRLEVTLAGFKKFVRSGITVGVTQNVSVDVRHPPGAEHDLQRRELLRDPDAARIGVLPAITSSSA